MAKKKDFLNVAEGFFVRQEEPEPVAVATVVSTAELNTTTQVLEKPDRPKTKSKKKITKTGRPRASDLIEGEEVFKTSIYLTDETLKKIDTYAVGRRIDRSEAIRRLIRKI